MRPLEKITYSRIGRKYPMPRLCRSQAKDFSKWIFVYATHQVPLRSASDSTSGVKIGGLSASLSISYTPQQLAMSIKLLILLLLCTHPCSQISETYANHLRMNLGRFSSQVWYYTGWVICPIRGTYGPSFRSCQSWQRLFLAFSLLVSFIRILT